MLVRDELAQCLARGGVAELVCERRDRSGARGGGDEFLGLGDIERERFFAQDVQPAREPREDGGAMIERRRGDREHVEFATREHLVDARERVRNLARVRDFRRTVGRRERDDVEASLRGEGRHVHRPAEARADDADAIASRARHAGTASRTADSKRSKARSN